MLTLAGHGFYWFELAKPAEPTPEADEGWESTTGSSVAQSLLDAGVVGATDAPAGNGGLGVESSGGAVTSTPDPDGAAR
jgi:maltose alpha-D-glucosyltransferase/alpha-amylase